MKEEKQGELEVEMQNQRMKACYLGSYSGYLEQGTTPFNEWLLFGQLPVPLCHRVENGKHVVPSLCSLFAVTRCLVSLQLPCNLLN